MMFKHTFHPILNAPVLVGIRHALRVAFAVADAQEEVGFVAGFVDDVGYSVAAFADAEVVFSDASVGEEVGQEHVVDVADVGQMAPKSPSLF